MTLITIILTIAAWNRKWKWHALWPLGLCLLWGVFAVVDPAFQTWNAVINLLFIVVLIAMIATNGNHQRLFTSIKVIIGCIAALFVASVVFENQIDMLLSKTKISNSETAPQVINPQVYIPPAKLSSFNIRQYNNRAWAIVTVYNGGPTNLRYIDVEISKVDSEESRRYRMYRFFARGQFVTRSDAYIEAYSSSDVGVEVGDFYNPSDRYTIRLAITETRQ